MARQAFWHLIYAYSFLLQIHGNPTIKNILRACGTRPSLLNRIIYPYPETNTNLMMFHKRAKRIEVRQHFPISLPNVFIMAGCGFVQRLLKQMKRFKFLYCAGRNAATNSFVIHICRQSQETLAVVLIYQGRLSVHSMRSLMYVTTCFGKGGHNLCMQVWSVTPPPTNPLNNCF
jgi:hypothetical protein